MERVIWLDEENVLDICATDLGCVLNGFSKAPQLRRKKVCQEYLATKGVKHGQQRVKSELTMADDVAMVGFSGENFSLQMKQLDSMITRSRTLREKRDVVHTLKRKFSVGQYKCVKYDTVNSDSPVVSAKSVANLLSEYGSHFVDKVFFGKCACLEVVLESTCIEKMLELNETLSLDMQRGVITGDFLSEDWSNDMKVYVNFHGRGLDSTIANDAKAEIVGIVDHAESYDELGELHAIIKKKINQLRTVEGRLRQIPENVKKLIAYEEKVISQRNAHLHSLIGDDADHASTITTTDNTPDTKTLSDLSQNEKLRQAWENSNMNDTFPSNSINVKGVGAAAINGNPGAFSDDDESSVDLVKIPKMLISFPAIKYMNRLPKKEISPIPTISSIPRFSDKRYPKTPPSGFAVDSDYQSYLDTPNYHIPYESNTPVSDRFSPSGGDEISESDLFEKETLKQDIKYLMAKREELTTTLEYMEADQHIKLNPEILRKLKAWNANGGSEEETAVIGYTMASIDSIADVDLRVYKKNMQLLTFYYLQLKRYEAQCEADYTTFDLFYRQPDTFASYGAYQSSKQYEMLLDMLNVNLITVLSYLQQVEKVFDLEPSLLNSPSISLFKNLQDTFADSDAGAGADDAHDDSGILPNFFIDRPELDQFKLQWKELEGCYCPVFLIQGAIFPSFSLMSESVSETGETYIGSKNSEGYADVSFQPICYENASFMYIGTAKSGHMTDFTGKATKSYSRSNVVVQGAIQDGKFVNGHCAMMLASVIPNDDMDIEYLPELGDPIYLDPDLFCSEFGVLFPSSIEWEYEFSLQHMSEEELQLWLRSEECLAPYAENFEGLTGYEIACKMPLKHFRKKIGLEHQKEAVKLYRQRRGPPEPNSPYVQIRPKFRYANMTEDEEIIVQQHFEDQYIILWEDGPSDSIDDIDINPVTGVITVSNPEIMLEPFHINICIRSVYEGPITKSWFKEDNLPLDKIYACEIDGLACRIFDCDILYPNSNTCKIVPEFDDDLPEGLLKYVRFDWIGDQLKDIYLDPETGEIRGIEHLVDASVLAVIQVSFGAQLIRFELEIEPGPGLNSSTFRKGPIVQAISPRSGGMSDAYSRPHSTTSSPPQTISHLQLGKIRPTATLDAPYQKQEEAKSRKRNDGDDGPFHMKKNTVEWKLEPASRKRSTPERKSHWKKNSIEVGGAVLEDTNTRRSASFAKKTPPKVDRRPHGGKSDATELSFPPAEEHKKTSDYMSVMSKYYGAGHKWTPAKKSAPNQKPATRKPEWKSAPKNVEQPEEQDPSSIKSYSRPSSSVDRNKDSNVKTEEVASKGKVGEIASLFATPSPSPGKVIRDVKTSVQQKQGEEETPKTRAKSSMKESIINPFREKNTPPISAANPLKPIEITRHKHPWQSPSPAVSDEPRQSKVELVKSCVDFPLNEVVDELGFFLEDPSSSFSVVLQIKFPNKITPTREWILKLGSDAGAHHMIWGGQNNVEFGFSDKSNVIRNVPLMKFREKFVCLACVWDGNFYRVYINGKQVKLMRVKNVKVASNEFRVFGRREILKVGQNETGFSGEIEKVEIYKGALTDLELGSHVESFE